MYYRSTFFLLLYFFQPIAQNNYFGIFKIVPFIYLIYVLYDDVLVFALLVYSHEAGQGKRLLGYSMLQQLYVRHGPIFTNQI